MRLGLGVIGYLSLLHVSRKKKKEEEEKKRKTKCRTKLVGSTEGKKTLMSAASPKFIGCKGS